MYVFITILIIVICFALGFVVLIQNPKGGGLNSSFGGVGNQILGARRSTDVVEKATWTLAVLLLAFSQGLIAGLKIKQPGHPPLCPLFITEGYNLGWRR